MDTRHTRLTLKTGAKPWEMVKFCAENSPATYILLLYGRAKGGVKVLYRCLRLKTFAPILFSAAVVCVCIQVHIIQM